MAHNASQSQHHYLSPYLKLLLLYNIVIIIIGLLYIHIFQKNIAITKKITQTHCASMAPSTSKSQRHYISQACTQATNFVNIVLRRAEVHNWRGAHVMHGPLIFTFSQSCYNFNVTLDACPLMASRDPDNKRHRSFMIESIPNRLLHIQHL
jgi:hypothetical protein